MVSPAIIVFFFFPKMQVFSRVIDLLGNNLNVMQIVLMHNFFCKKHQENTYHHPLLTGATQEYTKHAYAHTLDADQLPRPASCYKSRLPRLLFELSVRFRVILLLLIHRDSRAALFPVPTPTSERQVLFTVKCQTYRSIYVFLDHLRSVIPFSYFY